MTDSLFWRLAYKIPDSALVVGGLVSFIFGYNFHEILRDAYGDAAKGVFYTCMAAGIFYWSIATGKMLRTESYKGRLIANISVSLCFFNIMDEINKACTIIHYDQYLISLGVIITNIALWLKRRKNGE